MGFLLRRWEKERFVISGCIKPCQGRHSGQRAMLGQTDRQLSSPGWQAAKAAELSSLFQCSKRKKWRKRKSSCCLACSVGSRASGLGCYPMCDSRLSARVNTALLSATSLMDKESAGGQITWCSSFPRGSVVLSLLTLHVGLVLSVTTCGQANLRMWPAKLMPKRNLLMALEVQQDIWNCSPPEGVSEGGCTICEG